MEKAREAVEREEREREKKIKKRPSRKGSHASSASKKKRRKALLQFARDDFVHHDSLSIVDDVLSSRRKREKEQVFFKFKRQTVRIRPVRERYRCLRDGRRRCRRAFGAGVDDEFGVGRESFRRNKSSGSSSLFATKHQHQQHQR